MNRPQRLAAMIAGLGLWAAATAPSDAQLRARKEYPLPPEIRVVDTSLPYETQERTWTSTDDEGKTETKKTLEKIVKTENIPFSEDYFWIQTDKYTLIKDKDWLPSRIVGHTVSLLGKLIFWDWDYAWGQDAERTRAAVSMLENTPLQGKLTVRLNHNEALYDMTRLFWDDALTERNNIVARIGLGIPISLLDEIWAEFARGSYYNPLTQTVVCYSNLESITAHEIGHHKDFQRFTSDWEYMLGRLVLPVTLYQEWQASQNAKEFLSKEDQWQFARYLLPAFFTYLLGGYFVCKKILQRADLKSEGGHKDLDKIPEEKRPVIHPLQTLRLYGTWNAGLYAGIAAYNTSSPHAPEVVNCLAFLAGAWLTSTLLDVVLKPVIPYEHQR